ncbi:hypothetical protein SERLA73DRAFT_72063 [Serpula lacrymans var. lacrymans S7.3]|uniref:Uncharacterized protein n=2 Tax=Serpula lacrymans var. lacrymans TaxID=341189 RepID=F8PTU8_SERL3|nr:uncharacterized protein SERLADRAFT_436571 [Serpula lacrymans var. lacrymans S7.9]EGO01093.1 hypothetical protein SERLA73DRAFT_72063 [Serpula lacrymans var. lacrymans S7.3]EGO26751.1 hypothetical protein SERLADRAFT_436571 [Serpula lacrymans var. lacrymans S7.9]
MRPISSSSYTSAPFRSPSTCSLPQQSRKFRPLPLVPTPLSIAIATEDSDSSRPSSPRPLPVPPTYSSQPSSPSQSPLSSPLTPYSSRSLSLSSNTPRGPNSTRSDLLTPLKIPVLCRSSLSSVSTGQTLVTPISPACPSPFTTKRRRFSKLRRHFGEAPPYDLVFPSDGGPAGVSCPDTTSEGIVDIKPPSHHPCYEGGQNIDVGNDGCEGESESGSGSDGGNDEEHGDECCEMGYVLECANEAPQCTTKRFSAKWVQEKKGRRYTEKDYDGLLHRLRKL